MVIMFFGVTNVGKTVTGKRLAEKLGCLFFDLDEEIKKRLQTTLEQFMKDYVFSDERYWLKTSIVKDIIVENEEDMVIAVSPIFNRHCIESLINMKQVFPIELQDTKEHIFERLVFSDENDSMYKDEEYKNKHKEHYLDDIQDDIDFMKECFISIENKFFMNNMPVEQVVDGLMDMQEAIADEKNHTGEGLISKAVPNVFVDDKERAANLKSEYTEILRHIPILEDHGPLYMYYGAPYCDECDIYGDTNENGDNLILSYECHELCEAIAGKFEDDVNWLDIFDDNNIELEEIFDVDVEKKDFEIISSILLYMVASIPLEDKFIDALNNGYLIRLLERLEQLA